MPNDGEAAWAMTRIGNVVRAVLRRSPTRRYEPLRPGVESHLQQFDEQSIRRLMSRCELRVIAISVDDASPVRSRLGALAFAARRLLTRVTPWNFGREMLVVASCGPGLG
jgi:hypothetical protein